VRILFLDQFSELGGGQHALLDTVGAVQLRGWEPHVLLPGPGPLVDALQSRNVAVAEISCGPYGSGNKSIADSIRFTLDLRRQVRRIGDLVADENIDLVYVNGPRLLPAASLATPRRVPILFHVHSRLRGSALQVVRWSIRRCAATVVGCSKSVLEPLERNRHVISNGVRDLGYRERSFDGPWRIGIIGRIAPEKGQMEFVNAVALLKDPFPLARFVICGAPLFGTGSDYYDAVRLQAHGLPLEFIGWQPDVREVLNELDLLVVPSHEEGMGRIVLEAFSAGVPVVAFPAGGTPEAVVDGVTGFLTREFTAQALAARITDVMTAAPGTIREIPGNARQAWALSFTVDAYQRNITNLLETLPSESDPASRADLEAEMPLPRR
jgi:glycosyltransferase involved in cell wall biosynthesis